MDLDSRMDVDVSMTTVDSTSMASALHDQVNLLTFLLMIGSRDLLILVLFPVRKWRHANALRRRRMLTCDVHRSEQW